MKFRKKPVVIEARKYTAEACAEICEWVGLPHMGFDPNVCGVENLVIPTLEGEMQARPGDWIIKGVKGEFSSCKPEIFEATYEPA